MILAITKHKIRLLGRDFGENCIFHNDGDKYYFTSYDFSNGYTAYREFKPCYKEQVQEIVDYIVKHNQKIIPDSKLVEMCYNTTILKSDGENKKNKKGIKKQN